VKFSAKSVLLPALLALLALVACTPAARRAEQQARERFGGDPQRGAELIRRTGCGGCHRIPGITGAAGRAAPALQHLAAEPYLPGALPNTPENVVRWIAAPHSIKPETKMPDYGLTRQQASDIATYLWAQR
jgi:cytochrome c1